MDILKTILSVLNQVPADVWNILVEAAVGAFAVSPVVAAVKKFFSVDGERKMIIITTVFSLIAGAVAYLVKDPDFAPWVIPVTGFITLGMSQPVYYFAIKPLCRKLGEVIATKIAEATKVVEARAALVPEGGVPTAAPTISDFR